MISDILSYYKNVSKIFYEHVDSLLFYNYRKSMINIVNLHGLTSVAYSVASFACPKSSFS